MQLVAAIAKKSLQNIFMVVGVVDWPYHQHVRGGYKAPTKMPSMTLTNAYVMTNQNKIKGLAEEMMGVNFTDCLMLFCYE